MYACWRRIIDSEFTKGMCINNNYSSIKVLNGNGKAIDVEEQNGTARRLVSEISALQLVIELLKKAM